MVKVPKTKQPAKALKTKTKTKTKTSVAGKCKQRTMLTSRQLRNLSHDNTLQDWLERYHGDREQIKARKLKFRIKSRDLHRQFICQVITQIKSIIGAQSVQVLNRPEGVEDLDGVALSKIICGSETLALMKVGTPVIANAQLINRSEGICDIADLIVRSDYLESIFSSLDLEEMENISDSQFGPWYYVAVAIRFSQNEFCVDGIKLRNDPSIRHTKTRLYMQTRILDHYQHTAVDHALVVGRGYTWTQSKTVGGATVKSNTIDKPGVVLFDDTDSFAKSQLEQGIQWLTKLDAAPAADWNIVPQPTVQELYANCKLSVYDTPWAPVIQEIARDQDDITQLHHCTTKNRTIAHNNGFKSLSRVPSSEKLGYKSTTKVGQSINRYLCKDWDKLSSVKLPEFKTAMYLDFESLPVGSVKFIGDSTFIRELIYLANARVVTGQGETNHQFGVTTLDDAALDTETIERNLAKSLYQTLNDLKRSDPHLIIFTWSDAEARYLYKLEEKFPEYPLGSDHAYKIVDLHELFQEIILPGQTDNSLETVTRVLHKLGHDVEPKVSLNSNNIIQAVIWGSDSFSVQERQTELTRLLEYNNHDTKVLRAIVQSIQDEQHIPDTGLAVSDTV
jgi:hypothetical protein